MKVWLADYRVESSLRLAKALPELHFEHPHDEYKITISNVAETGPQSGEDLALQIIFQAETIFVAEQVAFDSARRFFAPSELCDWIGFQDRSQTVFNGLDSGVEHREQFAYGRDDHRDRPEALTPELLESVRELQRSPNSVALDRALRWYSAGAGSTLMEDQFQYFWFVLELIAETTNDRSAVADKCQRCRSELFCLSCEEVSTHRPFPRQQIETLLTRLKVATHMQNDLFAIRNGLMHGVSREQIEASVQEREPDFEFAEAVDFAGRTAFMAIFNAFGIKQSQLDRLVFASPDSFVSRKAVMKAHLVVGMRGDPAEPRLENVVLPTITAHRIDNMGNKISDESTL